MLKKEITYRDLMTNKSVTEVFYFNLTKFEAAELNLAEGLQNVTKSSNVREIVPLFSAIARKSVGTNLNGKYVKPVGYGDWFVASDAYSELFGQILGADDAENQMTLFIKNIVPPEFIPGLDEQFAKLDAASMDVVGPSDMVASLDSNPPEQS